MPCELREAPCPAGLCSLDWRDILASQPVSPRWPRAVPPTPTRHHEPPATQVCIRRIHGLGVSWDPLTYRT